MREHGEDVGLVPVFEERRVDERETHCDDRDQAHKVDHQSDPEALRYAVRSIPERREQEVATTIDAGNDAAEQQPLEHN